MKLSPPKQVYRKPEEDWQERIVHETIKYCEAALAWYENGCAVTDSQLRLFRSNIATYCFDDVEYSDREAKFDLLTSDDRPAIISQMRKHIANLRGLVQPL